MYKTPYTVYVPLRNGKLLLWLIMGPFKIMKEVPRPVLVSQAKFFFYEAYRLIWSSSRTQISSKIRFQLWTPKMLSDRVVILQHSTLAYIIR